MIMPRCLLSRIFEKHHALKMLKHLWNIIMQGKWQVSSTTANSIFFIIWNYIFFLYISIQRKQYPYSFQKRLTNIYFASMRKIWFLPYPCTNCQTVLNRQKYFYRNMPFLENYNSLFVESRKYYEDISKVCNMWWN